MYVNKCLPLNPKFNGKLFITNSFIKTLIFVLSIKMSKGYFKIFIYFLVSANLNAQTIDVQGTL